MKNMTAVDAAAAAKAKGEPFFYWHPCIKCGTTARYVSNKRCVRCQNLKPINNDDPAVIFIRRVVHCFGLDEVIAVSGFEAREINDFLAGENLNDFVIQCFLDSLAAMGHKIIKGDS